MAAPSGFVFVCLVLLAFRHSPCPEFISLEGYFIMPKEIFYYPYRHILLSLKRYELQIGRKVKGRFIYTMSPALCRRVYKRESFLFIAEIVGDYAYVCREK